VRYSSDHKAKTRARVLREASREVRTKGPDHVAVAGIMKRVGLTHGGFYSHFPSKDTLVIEAIDAMFADALKLSRVIEDRSEPRAALLGYIDVYLSVVHRDARERGCPMPALAGDLARATSTARDRFAAGVAVLTERLSAAVAALGLENSDAEASAILSQMVGAVALARAVDGPASDAILENARSSLVARYGLAKTS
jgi:TetR/AcrR family transcriptional repressor of nem operon